jgi:hypothetical protein
MAKRPQPRNNPFENGNSSHNPLSSQFDDEGIDMGDYDKPSPAPFKMTEIRNSRQSDLVIN